MSGLKPMRRTLAGWRGSLHLRLLVGALTWILLTIGAAGWALSALFGQHVERQFHAELGTHLNQLVANLGFDEEGNPELEAPLSDPRLVRPYSGLYWQIDRMNETAGSDGQALLRSRSLWDAVLVVPADTPPDGEIHTHRLSGPDGDALRMIEQVLRPAEHPDQALRIIVAANERLITEPLERFNGLLVFALGVLAIGLAGAVVVQVVSGLRPMTRLRDALTEVRDGRKSAIEGRFPSEIQPLVDEFNGVLARNAEVVSRARTQAGNLAHAVKTPLTVLANAAATVDSPLARTVAEQVALARRQVDHHLSRARAAAAVQMPGQRTLLRPVLEALVRVMSRVHFERGLTIVLADWPDDLAFRGEEQDLQEILGNLLDNACKWAATRVDVSATSSGDKLVVVVEDDGRGLAPSVREAVFARGVRADELTPGSGLGLAIARDLALLYGGDIALDSSMTGGLRATLQLPRA